MAISHIYSNSVNATSVSLATTPSAGDLIITTALVTSTTSPTAPSGYTSVVSTQGAFVSNAQGGTFTYYKVATGGESSVVWTNAIWTEASIYRPGAGNSIAVGAIGSNGAGSATATISAITPQDTSGRSWVYGALGVRSSDTAITTTTFTGLTRRTAAGTTGAGIASYDTNAGVSSFAATTKALTTSGSWFTATVELKEVLPAISGTLSKSDPVDTASMSGSAAWTGTLSGTAPLDTASFSGSVTTPTISGTLAATDPTDTASLSGSVASSSGSSAGGTWSTTDHTSGVALSNSNLTATNTVFSEQGARGSVGVDPATSTSRWVLFTVTDAAQVGLWTAAATLGTRDYSGVQGPTTSGYRGAYAWNGSSTNSVSFGNLNNGDVLKIRVQSSNAYFSVNNGAETSPLDISYFNGTLLYPAMEGDAATQSVTIDTSNWGSPVATLPLDFTTGVLPTGVTATGGANGTRQNSSGVLVSATAPRFDYTSAGASRGILIEPAATNVVLYSQTLTDASWNKDDVTFGTPVTGPDGVASSAQAIVEGTQGGYNKQIYKGATLAAGQATISGFIKAVGRNWAQMNLWDGANDHIAWFNLGTGVVGSKLSDVVSSSITPFANGWYWITFTTDAFLHANAAPGIGSEDADGDTNYAGDGRTSVYIYAAQLEAGTGTSYIPTTSAAVTRSADSVSFTIPTGVTSLKFTFDDSSTQTVTGLTPGSVYTIPTTLNRPRIKTVADAASGGVTTTTWSTTDKATAVVLSNGNLTATISGGNGMVRATTGYLNPTSDTITTFTVNNSSRNSTFRFGLTNGTDAVTSAPTPMTNHPGIAYDEDATSGYVIMPNGVNQYTLAGVAHAANGQTVRFRQNGANVWISINGATELGPYDSAAGTTTALYPFFYGDTDGASVSAVFQTSSSSSITGTLSASDPVDTASLSGTVTWPTITGTLTSTDTVDSASINGGVTTSGALSSTDAVDTATVNGGVTTSGALGATDAVDTAAFNGGVKTSGTFSATDVVDTASFNGNEKTAGTLNATDAVDSASLTGSVSWPTITGTLSATDPTDTASFNDGGVISGNVNAVDPQDSATFTGSIKTTGTLAAPDTVDTAAISGTETISGSLAATDATDSATISGVITTALMGVLAASDAADTASISGSIKTTGTMSASEAPDAMVFIVGVGTSGTLSGSAPLDTASISGSVYHAVVLAATEGSTDSAVFIANLSISGQLAGLENADLCAIRAKVYLPFTQVTEASDTWSVQTQPTDTWTPQSDPPDTWGPAQ